MKREFKWEKKYLYWGITAFLVIVASITFFTAVSHWRGGLSFVGKLVKTLSPVIYGLIFTYLLNKAMMFFENAFLRRLGARLCKKRPAWAKRVTRALGVLLTMALALVVVGGALALILPQIYSSVESLVARMPRYVRTAVQWIERILADNPELENALVNLVGNFTEWLTDWIQSSFLAQGKQIITNLTSGVIGVLREIANILIGVVVAVYVLYHKEKFAAQSKKALYGVFKTNRANALLRGLHFTDKTCGSFVTSKLIDSLIVGIVCYVAMILLKMPYPALISVMVGVTNVVPFFGPFIGGIPSALLVLLENPAKALIFVIFVVILQQLDGNVLYPRIQGGSIGLSGFWILFAILLFGGLFGFWGFILGVPVFAVIYAAVKSFVNGSLTVKGMPTDTELYERALYFTSGTNEPVYKNAPAADGDVKTDETAD
ncbi:MAG: AI-2E family transporter [Oscillospiraceae bacterium]|nr:AI-2E family transporter [Oscillospiraceae bacterium]